MKFSLKQLIVENFKAFKNRSIHFKSTNLILLDGPNGFGKTSFYDALELLFLGKVQRYINIETQTTYGRKPAKTYPLLFDRAEPAGVLLIQLVLELDSGELVTLKRTAKCSDLMGLKQLNDAVFTLEIFKGEEKIEFTNEIQILSELLGDNYQYNYNLFYYIEQEENTAILKSRATHKQDKIDHLFDVSEYRAKIDKIQRIRKSLSPLKTDSKKRALVLQEAEIVKLEKSVSDTRDQVEPYSRLINATEQAWDKESVTFEAGSYAYWLDKNGELEKIRCIKEAETDFVNNRYNLKIQKEFSLTTRVIQPLLRFAHRIELIPKYKSEIELYESSTRYLDLLKQGPFKLIMENSGLPPVSIISILDSKIDFSVMESSIEDIKAIINTSSQLTQALSKLVTSHDIYISEYKEHQALKSKQETSCPTCGYDWKEYDLLTKQFDKQKQAFSSLLEGQSTLIQTNLQSFEKKYVETIKVECENIIKKEGADIAYKLEICKLTSKQSAFLTKLKQTYFDYGIDLSDLYAQTLSLDEVLKTSILEKRVGSFYKPVNLDLLQPEFDDLFKAIFNGEIEELTKLQLKDVERKVNYLKQRFAESRLHEIDTKRSKLKIELEAFKEASQIDTQLKKLEKLYTENIANYIRSISEGIEILFHIYSGRLLQNFQNGLGVFIDTDGKSVSFKDTPESEHDVIFSMSSGQLSSLVIAFTLALNHRYAKNDLLLIDDPVQTMDEINVAGFIDLLRYQFKNRQIFISTHEDHTSSYFRYKFSKARLEQERINFKELSKLEHENHSKSV